MSPSSEQSSKSTHQHNSPVEFDPQSVSDAQSSDTIKGENQESHGHDSPQLKGPPRRPATPPPTPPLATPQAVGKPDTLVAAEEEDTASADSLGQQPIPPPSEPMQYRAIGLIKGKYQPSEEQFNRGVLITEDQTHLDAVLLGQVMSLVKKYLDLETTYLWVVYPRTREKEETLHMQIVGIWSAEGFGPMAAMTDETDPPEQPAQLAAPLQDGYFSIRGEIVFQSTDKNYLLVKIQQSPRKSSDRPKAFKLKLAGNLTDKTLGYFWDLHIQRQGEELAIIKGQRIALVPPKRRSKQDLQDSRKPRKFKQDNDRSKPYSASEPRAVSKLIKKRSTPES